MTLCNSIPLPTLLGAIYLLVEPNNLGPSCHDML